MALENYTKRLKYWATKTFGVHVALDKKERASRFAEESIETMQAMNLTKEQVLSFVDYVYSRPVGELDQEMSGSLITLLLAAESFSVDLEGKITKEVHKIVDLGDKIREKHNSKPDHLRLASVEGFTNVTQEYSDLYKYLDSLCFYGFSLRPKELGSLKHSQFVHCLNLAISKSLKEAENYRVVQSIKLVTLEEQERVIVITTPNFNQDYSLNTIENDTNEGAAAVIYREQKTYIEKICNVLALNESVCNYIRECSNFKFNSLILSAYPYVSLDSNVGARMIFVLDTEVFKDFE
jgi:hypothetical protein